MIMPINDDSLISKCRSDNQVGSTARKLQYPLPKSFTLGPTEYAASKSPGASSRFFKSGFLNLFLLHVQELLCV